MDAVADEARSGREEEEKEEEAIAGSEIEVEAAIAIVVVVIEMEVEVEVEVVGDPTLPQTLPMVLDKKPSATVNVGSLMRCTKDGKLSADVRGIFVRFIRWTVGGCSVDGRGGCWAGLH